MKKTKFKNKFKLISTSDKKRIKGGCHHNNNGNNNGSSINTGGVPPYKPGGTGDDRDD